MDNIKKRIVILASDHAGFPLKDAIKSYLLTKENFEIIDKGCDSADESVDYPDFVKDLCSEVSKNKNNKGIVVCGSGIGISIAANKIKGIRCALLHDQLGAKLSREHNNSNVMSLGAGFLGKELAKNIVDTFLNTEFSGEERHQRRIDKITQLENKY
jgi:ribose 5-phosphate isomerase B